jgi:hypothetical protein
LGTEAGRTEETAEAPPVRAEAAATPTGGETVKGYELTGGPEASAVTAALLAGTASPVRVTLVAATATATAVRAARRRLRNSTMYKTLYGPAHQQKPPTELLKRP